MRRKDELRLLQAVVSVLFLGLAAPVQAGEGLPKLPPLQCLDEKGKVVVPAARVKKVGHGVSRPELLTPLRLAWPRDSRVLGIIIVEAVIDSSGRVCAVRAIRAPSPEIGKIFEDALREAQFKPARLNGKAVPIWYVFSTTPHVQ